ncbi:MAG: hypothetical protein AAFZ05_14175, partial [Pseudomonadota bacterium]
DPATASPGNRLGNAVVINEKLTDASPLDRKLPLNSANAPDKADVKCVAGNQVCPGEVDKLLADRTLAWISKSARAEDYVSGARLIAYSRVRNEMSCKQIARGLDEAQTALIALGAAISDESKLGRPTGNLTATRRIAVAVRDQLNGARKARC